MGDEVQRIVHGDTDNDRTDTDHYQRHITADHRDQSHGKQPAKGDGGTDEQEVLHLLECKYQQSENQGDSDGDGPMTVTLDLFGIADSDDRGTCDSHIDIRHCLHRLVNNAIYIFHQQTVVCRLHTTIR